MEKVRWLDENCHKILVIQWNRVVTVIRNRIIYNRFPTVIMYRLHEIIFCRLRLCSYGKTVKLPFSHIIFT